MTGHAQPTELQATRLLRLLRTFKQLTCNHIAAGLQCAPQTAATLIRHLAAGNQVRKLDQVGKTNWWGLP